MPSNHRGLGRGLDALIPTELEEPGQFDPINKVKPGGEQVTSVAPSAITPNPHQPRQQFDQAALDELAASIKQYGVVQPLVVTDLGGGKYELIAGERRLRASKQARLASVPVIVRSFDEQAKLEVALIENVQRAELNALETAMAYKKLMDQFNLKLEEVARRVGKNMSTVSNTVRLLGLPPEAMEALVNGSITEGHARAILALKDPGKRGQMLEMIIAQNLTVRQAEHLARGFKPAEADTKKAMGHVATTNQWTQALTQKLGTNVAINRSAKGGRLVISYKDDQDLERISKQLLG